MEQIWSWTGFYNNCAVFFTLVLESTKLMKEEIYLKKIWSSFKVEIFSSQKVMFHSFVFKKGEKGGGGG